MHSSISNFRRPVPTAHWPRVWLLTGGLLLLAIAAWEGYWRGRGYLPQYNDSADAWAEQRQLVGRGDGQQTVIIGASRVRFDLNLDVWQQMTGRRPIMLGMDGTCAWPILEDLAQEENFSGTVICGVTEGLLFAPGFSGPAQQAYKNIRYARGWSPSQRVAFEISSQLETRLAMLNGWDLSLGALLTRWLPLSNRAGAVVMPALPPLFAVNHLDRQAVMWRKVENDVAFAGRIQQIWLPLFTFFPPLAGPPLDGVMQSLQESVKRIQARGGQVIFVRLPSTGGLLEVERQNWPRTAYWERLLAVTGARGIHFEDYGELRHYDCPEWSHLNGRDARTFTSDLIRIMQ